MTKNFCTECNLSAEHSRGLCMTCYTRARRNGTLAEHPTVDFIRKPELYIRWMFQHNPELVKEEAERMGFKIELS